MMLNKAYILFIVFILSGCKDLFETDIKESQVKLYAPQNGLFSKLLTVNFWWEELSGATKYRLQIIQTDKTFQDSINLVSDTTISKNQFRKSLNPGYYLWSVLATNSAYNALRSNAYRLQIDSVSISGQEITITSPSDTSFQNTNTYKLTWEPLGNAKQYKIFKDTVGGKEVEEIVPGNVSFYNLTMPRENIYSLSLQAEEGTLKSNKSEKRVIVFDKTPPNSIKLISPGDSATIPSNLNTINSKDIALSWEAGKDDKGGINSYKVNLYNGNNLVDISKSKYNGVATNLNIGSLNLSQGTTFSWNVIATDKAKNVSIEPKRFYFRTK